MLQKNIKNKSQLVFCMGKYIPAQITKSKPNIFCFLTHTNGLNYCVIWMRSSASFLGYFAEFWHLIILQAGKQVTEARRQLSSLAELKKILTYHTYTPPSANLPVSLFKCLESNLLNCKPTEFCTKYEPHRKAEGIS